MYQKVLVLHDGSALAECALPHVKNLARGGNIEKIILLSAAIFNNPYGIIGKDIDFGSLHSAQMQESQDYLARVQSQLSAEGIKTEKIVIAGDNPANTIIDYT
jgi:nucleotide-binding universal stress UspA family protein